VAKVNKKNRKEVVWLIGDGRSGSTWVSNLINYDNNYREMFEPFHPLIYRDINFMAAHQYVRPYTASDKLKSVSSDIFSGKLTNERVDSGNTSKQRQGILIKDIFANLLCYSMSLEFPKVKPVLLIRNPFAVAISKYKKRNWYWATEPLDLLQQSDLYKDHLMPFEEVLRLTSAQGNYILNQLVIWCVINFVPLHQFKAGDIHICFYESIYSRPGPEITKILQFVRGPRARKQGTINISDEIINNPSRAAGPENNISAGTSPVISWKNEIPMQVIDAGMAILECFGFEDLYDVDGMPNENVTKLMQQS